jgi:DNA ligase-4
MKFYSFFKVGGGFRADDYAAIRHHTEGKWTDWDRKNPPIEYIDIGGPDGSVERPDVWIKPSDSVVVEVKAASVINTDSFKTTYSLRFPRFKRLRTDKSWETALSTHDFILLKAKAEAESREKEMKIDSGRKRLTKRSKKDVVIAGDDSKIKTPYAGPQTQIFEGLNFCVLSEMLHPQKMSKGEIEQMIKGNGGRIFQSPTAEDAMICIADKNVVKVASLIKSAKANIVRPAWLLDASKQVEIDGPQMQRLLTPFEPSQMFFTASFAKEMIEWNVDEYGDSYARDVTGNELKRILSDMTYSKDSTFSGSDFIHQLDEHGKTLGAMPGSIFRGCVVYFVPSTATIAGDSTLDLDLRIAKHHFLFASGKVAENDKDEDITHFLIIDEARAAVKQIREKIADSGRQRYPRFVGLKWIQDSWKEKTLLDEERYAVL